MPADLRSDTTTRPTPAMRRAMADAVVGDAEYDDDPTVLRLQERAAEITGKEAAIYLVTGTMCNQIALHLLARPGFFVVCSRNSHVGNVELATSSMLSGIAFREIDSDDGTLRAEDLDGAFEEDADRGRIVDLVSVENTHSMGGGTPWAIDDLRGVRKVANEAGVPLYMDASRVFNASAATGTPVADYAAETDALMFCLSKGLGAPIGSVLCGSEAFIREAKGAKILFGISWRQAGVTAAAGLVALETAPQRLHEDHERTRRLAEGLAEITPYAVDLRRVRTNMIFARTAPLGLAAPEAEERLAALGVLVNYIGDTIRFVTHIDVSDDDVDQALTAWSELAAAARS
ncbi:MAG: threonine aldolase family protein [Actinomycetota bacterium]